jgi:hypothetical protein
MNRWNRWFSRTFLGSPALAGAQRKFWKQRGKIVVTYMGLSLSLFLTYRKREVLAVHSGSKPKQVFPDGL